MYHIMMYANNKGPKPFFVEVRNFVSTKLVTLGIVDHFEHLIIKMKLQSGSISKLRGQYRKNGGNNVLKCTIRMGLHLGSQMAKRILK